MALKLKKRKLKKIDSNAEIRHLGVLMENMNDKIILLAEGHGVLVKSIDKLDGRMDRMEGKMDKMEIDISVLKTDVSILKADISVLKSDVSVLKSDVSVLKTDVSISKTDVSVLKTDSLDLKSGQSQILDYLFRIENEIQDLKKDLEENYEKKGHDKKWRELIEERLEKIEKALTRKTFSGAGVARDGK